ncbi:MAG: nucleoside-diphosphate kinase [Chloroflexi bacterium 13_1_40CM_4_68_4]|nr:MAG: nucleoside-diphosphate kinase [Chloroflexi bacterium 13_1_40CM_4_68_4]
MERSLVIFKPDAVQRAIVGELLARFERRGLRIVGLKVLSVDRTMARRHYDVHKGKFFFDDLVKTITSSPVVACVLEGPNAIAVIRAMVGATRPHEAAPGTIRGDYALVGLRNLVHASDALDTAKSEIAFWFTDAELVTYRRDLERWLTDEGPPS